MKLRSGSLVLLLAVMFAPTLSALSGTRDFELVSINSGNTASGNGASLNPVVSSNGQYVAFASDATNLVPNDNNGARDVFWRDRISGLTRLVSRTPAGASGNRDSDSPVISPDGRYVAFHSRASNLVANDNNTNYDVFVWDSTDNTVTLISQTPGGVSGAGDSFSPQLSGNGRVVSFASTAPNLVANDNNGTVDAFARDLDQGVTYLASMNSSGFSGNGSCGVPVISANGRYVAFLSSASDLVTNDFNNLNDAFVHDLQTRQTKLVSVNAAGTGSGNRLSFDPVISADGRYVAFASQATNLVSITDTNDFPDVFVRDMQVGVTKLVSVNRNGTGSGGNGGISTVLPASYTPFLSADGTKVLFVSSAQDLVANDSNGKQDVFLRDHINNTTTLISTNRFGTGSGNAASGIGTYSMSADLRYVAFFSEAANLGAADTNNRTDVFVRDLATNSTKIISRVNLGGFSGNGHSYQPVISADGSTVVFLSEADNLDNRDTNRVSDVFAAATTLSAPSFDLADVGVSISSVSPQTVGGNCTVTITVTNHSDTAAIGLAVDTTTPTFLQFLSGTTSQGPVGSAQWLVGDLPAHGSATATLTLVATRLDSGNVIASITRHDQLDPKLSNNVALSTVTINQTAAGALYHLPGSTPYLSRTNSPFFAGIVAGSFTLETFEGGVFSIAGVTASTGMVLGPSNLTDSVDADDGLIDGSGNGGRSFFVTGTNSVTFSFDAALLGRLPTKVGIVLTDGDPGGAGIEAFDTNGVSLGVIGPFEIGDHSFFGETAEDRFLGVEFAGGISALRVYYASPGFELDHLQFDIPTTDLALSLSGPASASFGTNFVLTYAVTNRGAVTATSVVVTNASPGLATTAGFSPSQGSVSLNGTWTIGALLPGASATLAGTFVPTGSGALLFAAGVSSTVADSDTSNDRASFSIPVPNLAPSIGFASNSLSLLEDMTALSLPGFASFSSRETNQSVASVTVSVDNPALFSVPPSILVNGALSLTLAANKVGTALVTVVATDDGGTANGGVDKATNTFTITVTPVNDAPSVTFATNVVAVLEDAGAQTVPGFVSASAGPADEIGQSITNYTVTAMNSALFSVQPAVALNGTLTFTSATNGNGSSTVTVIAQDDGGTASGGVNKTTNTFTITVTPVNDAPSVTFATNAVAVLEDAGAQTVSGFVSASAGPADEVGQSITNYTVTAVNSALFFVQPVVTLNGSLTFTPATNANGSSTVTVIAQDDGGTANGGINKTTNTFTITVTPVNDPPTFSFATNVVTVLENAGLQSLPLFVTAISGPADEAGQSITNYTVTAGNSALFSVQPAVGLNGKLTFTTATNANGSSTVTVIAQDDGGIANGGVDKTTNSFTIMVTDVNNAPVVSFSTNLLVVLEHAGPQTFPGFVTAQVAPGQHITNYTVTYTAPGGIFATEPAVALDGTLTFTAAVTANGTATLNVIAQHDGGTANGGEDRATNSFTLTVTPVNDAPSFVFSVPRRFRNTTSIAIPDEASGVPYPSPITVSGVGATVTNVSVTLFGLSHSFLPDASILLVGPQGQTCMLMRGVGAYAGQGGVAGVTLTIDPSPANPYMTNLTLMSGHTYRPTVNGGAGSSLAAPAPAAPYTADLSVFNGVNPNGVWSLYVVDEAAGDVGAIAGGWSLAFNGEVPELAVLEDSGSYSGANFVTNVLAGPQDELTQSVTFLVTNSNPALFSVQPALAADGTLTFRPAVDANGFATVTVVAQDDGSTTSGGVDKTTNTFTLTVTPVNDAPFFSLARVSFTVLEDSGPFTDFALLVNPVPGPGNEGGQTIINYTLTPVGNAAGLFSAPPTLSVNGTLTFTPAPNATGTGVFYVRAFDNGDSTNGGTNGSGIIAITINVIPVNDAPSVTFASNNVVVLEDAGAQTLVAFATAGIGPANETGQTITNYTVTSTAPALFSVGPALALNGTLTFTPAANANGSATVTVVVQDDGGTTSGGVDRATNTFTITLLPVNDPPVVTLASNPVVVAENAGAQTLAAFATAVLGPADEASQSITNYSVANNNTALFSVQPAISLAGTLTFTPMTSATGSAVVTLISQDDGGTVDGGVNKTTNTFTIAVSAVNDPPSFAFGFASQPLITNVTSWGWNDAGQQHVPADFTNAVQIAGGGYHVIGLRSDGTLVGWADASGGATTPPQGLNNVTAIASGSFFSLALKSDGSVVAWGDNSHGQLNVPASVTDIVAIAAGDAHGLALTRGGQVIGWGFGDSGQTNTPVGLANVTNISANGFHNLALKNDGTVVAWGEDGAGQATVPPGLTNVVAVSAGFFHSLALKSDGTVVAWGQNGRGQTMVPADLTNAVAIAAGVYHNVALRADGTVVAWGYNDVGQASVPEGLAGVTRINAGNGTSFAIGTNVNFGPSLTVLEDSGAFTLPLAVTNIVAGPNNESAQVVTFLLTNSNPGLFGTQPAIAANGTLTFTPAPNAYGSARVTVVAQDDGGILVGGVDKATNTFVIVVTPVNDPPSLVLAANPVTVLEDAGAQTVPAFATGGGGLTNESSQRIIGYQVNNDYPALFSVQPAIAVDGTLTFTPATDANGSAIVTVIAQDSGGTGYGGVDTKTNTFTLTVTAVNDAPTLVLSISTLGVAEDNSLSVFANLVSSFSPGPANESSQTLVRYLVSNDNAGLFAVAPAVDVNGTLTFQGATNATGTITVTVQAQDSGDNLNGGTNLSAPQTFLIFLQERNDAPSFTFASNNVIALEDAGAITVSGFIATSSVGPAQELASQLITNYAVSTTSSSLFSVLPTIATNGTLTFTPAPNAFGVGTITVVAQDNGGTGNGGADKATNTFTITVTAVNDAPVISFAQPTMTVVEDAGTQTVTSFVAAATGPANESGQSITNYLVTAGNPTLFSVQPAVALNGTLTFTPAANANGTTTVTVIAQDDGGILNGGVDKTTNTFSVAITAVNDAPAISFAQTTVTVLEDAVAQTMAGFVTPSTGPANESAQSITNYTVANNNTVLFAVQPAVALNGTLTFTPAANKNGTATVTVIAQDDGGSANSGVDKTTNTFTIAITAVNDAPTISFAQATVTVLEDATVQTLATFVTVTSVGPTDEAAQSITNYAVANNNTMLFSVQPAVALNGTLNFTPAANANGSATVTVIAQDDGGIANGGVDKTTNTFTITVTAVNDAPAISFAQSVVSVPEDEGVQTLPGFVTVTSVGPVDEASQSITNYTVANNNSTLFSVQPAVALDGTLTFTSALDVNGSATVTVVAEDDGGTAGGGVNKTTNTFTITITPVNDAPSFAIPAWVNWTARDSSRNWSAIAASADGTKLVAVVNGGAIYTSTDSGATWEEQKDPPVQDWNAVASSADGTKLVATANNGHIYTSTDSGVNWVMRDLSREWRCVASSADGTKLVAGVENGQLFTSTDSGLTWTPRESARVWLGVASCDDGTRLVATAMNDHIYTSTDSGQTWTPQENHRAWRAVTSSADGSKLVAAEQGGKIYTSIDYGVNWTARENDRDWYFLASSADGTKLAGVVNNGQIYTSADSGVTWAARESNRVWLGVTASADGSSFAAVATGERIYTATEALTVLATEDSGPYTQSSFASSISLGPVDEAGQSVAFMVSNDNNALFSTQPAVDAGGTLTFTPTANAVGSATVSIYAQDDGGTADRGVDLSPVKTFTITVTAVNDAPAISFAQATVTVLEDATAQTMASFVTPAFGPANESSQTITNYSVANNNTALFSTQPAVALNGTLTFTPAANKNGSATVTVIAQDDGGTTDAGVDKTTNTFTITITAVNDAPVISFAQTTVTVLEDAATQTMPAFVTPIVGPADETAQSITNYSVANNNPALFSTQPAVGLNGTLTFTPAGNKNGSATVTVIAQDDGGTANAGVDKTTNTFTITITAVNDAPAISFAQATVTVLEDAAPQSMTSFVTVTSVGPTDEAGQSITNYSVANNNTTLFSTQPAVALNGTLTFTPAANANGSATVTVIAQDDGGTANAGVDKTTNTFTITITAVNDAPALSFAQPTVTVLEDAAAQSMTAFVLASGGQANETGQSITNFAVANNNTALFSTQPAVALNGTLTFTPAANANGSATVTVIAEDDGGTANAGVNKTTNTFTITVTAVNDAPAISFAQATVTVLEGATSQTVASFVTVTSVGPADESAQSITNYSVANNNTGLFSAQPAVALNGTLTFTPAANANGSATVTVIAQDDGGTANAGMDKTTNTFTITITAVNDAPAISFAQATVTVLEDAAAQTVASFVTVTSVGPADESAQTITNYSVANNNTALFSTQPAVALNGTLTFTPATNANGSATVTVIAQDDGGTANAGVDKTTNTFTITITAVNDAPAISFAQATVTVLEDAGTQTVTSFVTPSYGPADESTQAITNYAVASSDTTLFSVQPAVALDGTLTFTPAANANGSATVTVIAQDDGGTANAGVDKTTNTFTITITAVNDAPSFVLNEGLISNLGSLSGNGSASVLLIWDDLSAGTLALKSALETAGLSVTLSATSETNYTGSNPSPTGFDAVIHLNGSTYTNDMPLAGQDALVSYVQSGGTFIASEWNAYELANGRMANMRDLILFDKSNTSIGIITYTNVPAVAGHPVLTGVAGSFTLSGTPAYNVGQVHSFAPNPATVLMRDSHGNDGVAVRFFGAGRVVNFSHSGNWSGQPALSDANIQQLYVNAAKWNGSYGVTVLEDSGPFTLALAVTNIVAGPADESGQVVTFVVTNSNNALFLVQPALDGSASGTPGTLRFTPATNASGTAIVGVVAHDSGGVLSGGADASGVQTFAITVTAVNDAPTVTFASNLVYAAVNAGLQTSAGFATYTTGDTGQTITNTVTSNNNPALFDIPPAVSTNGTLTFTPVAQATGTATVTVVATDSGGTSNGGVDRATNTFTISVVAVNLAPSFTFTSSAATDGVQDWVRDLGSFFGNEGRKVVTDSSGNVIVAGEVEASQTTDIIVVKYAPDGTAQWTNTFNGPGGAYDLVSGLALDNSGNVLVTGSTFDSSYDFVTIKYSANGTPVWTNYYDGGVEDKTSAIVIDQNGDVIVTGSSTGATHTDYLTIKYASDGTPVWTNRHSYSGPGDDYPKSIAVDTAGDVYVTGEGSNSDYVYAHTLKFSGADGTPVWTNDFSINGENSYGVSVGVDPNGDVLVAANYLEATVKFAVIKYSSAGVPVWTNLYNRSNADEHIRAMVLDSSGNPIITGDTYNGGDLSYDYTTIKYLNNGTPAWTNHYNGGFDEQPNAITVNSSGDVFVSGQSYSQSNGKDYLTVKYSAAGSGVWTNRYNNANNTDDVARSVAVDTSGNVYVTGTSDDVIRTVKYASAAAVTASKTVLTTAGSVTVTNFIGSTSVGAGESGTQTITNFNVSSDNSALFSVQPAIGTNGTLTFTVSGFLGTAVVSVSAQDDGGTFFIGTNISPVQTFTITVVNPPGATPLSYIWQGATGDWRDPAQWLPRGVPGPNDSVTIAGGVVSVTNGVQVAGINLTGGTIDGAGLLSLRTNFTWSAGTLSGTGTTLLESGVALLISGSSSKTLNRRLDNHGTVTFTGTGSLLGNTTDTVVNNYSDGIFDIQVASGTMLGTTAVFTNAGTLKKSVGSSMVILAAALHSTGTVYVELGNLSLTGGGTLAGVSTNVSGQVFELRTGTFQWLSGMQYVGTGVGRILTGATVDVATNVTVTIKGGGMQHLGGTLGGAGNVQVQAFTSYIWSGGSINGSGIFTLATNATMLVAGSGDLDLGRQLDNYGTVSWSSGRLLGSTGVTINNYAGALINTKADVTLFESFDATTKTLNNYGTVRKSTATGTSTWYGVFNNNGTVDVLTGTLNPVGTVTLNTSAYSGSGRFLLGNCTVNGTLTNASGSNVEFASGTLSGTGTIIGTLNWTGGTLGTGGTLTIATNGVLVASGVTDKSLNRRLDNLGTITWTGGRIIGDSSPVLNNLAGAVFDSQTDTTLFDSNDATVKTFNNSGTVKKTAGTGTSTWNGLFNNSSTLNVQTGTLALTGGGSSSGTFTNATGAVTAFTGGTQVLANGVLFTGAGTNQIAGGTVTVVTNGTASVTGTFELVSGVLGGDGTFLVPSGSQFNWKGGVMSGTGTTTNAAGGILTASTATDKSLNRRLDNSGTVTWTAGRIIGDETPVINNYAGALFDTQVDATLFDSNDATVKTFNNSGTVRKSAGTGNSIWQGVFNHSGIADVQTGTLYPSGTVTLNTSTNLGPGRLYLTGCTINGTITNAAGANVEFAGGTLSGTGTIIGTLNWTGGTFGTGGILTLATNGVLVASGATDKSLNRQLDNYGTITWTGGRIIGDSTPVLNNQAGALFDAQVDTTLFDSNDGTVKTFNNSGTVRKSAGTGTSAWNGLFNNSSTLSVQSGIVALTGGGASSGAFTVSSGKVLTFTGGTQVLANGVTFSGAGTSRVDGGTVTVVTNGTASVTGTFELVSGVLGGDGSFNVPAGSQFNWKGGTMSGYGRTTVASLATLTASTVADKSLNRRLDNNGTVLWTAGRIIGDDSPVINNNAGAVFETQVDAALFDSNDATVKTFNNSGTVRKTGGTGTSTWNGVFNQSGTLEIRKGIVSIAGNFSPAAGSAVTIYIGGLLAGTQSGQLQVGGTATLTGTLNVVLTNSFLPVVLNVFPVFTSTSRSGTFATITGDNLGGNLSLIPSYLLGNLNLVATLSLGLPRLAPQVITGDRQLRWPNDGSGYELQTATAITGPWMPVLAPVAQENGDSVIHLPAEGTRFYRLVQPAPPRPVDSQPQ